MKWAILVFVLLLIVPVSAYVDLSKYYKYQENTTVQELGRFSSQPDVVYWSEETKKFVTGTGSKLDIDNYAGS